MSLACLCSLPAQDESTAEITFYMKGADVAMSSVVQYNDWLEEEVSSRLTRAAVTGGSRHHVCGQTPTGFWTRNWLSTRFFFFFFFNVLFIFETETEHELGRVSERETQNLKRAPGSELSAQSPTRGSNSRTARS